MRYSSIVFRLTICILIFSGCNTGVVNNGSGTLTTNGICISSDDGVLSGYLYTGDTAANTDKIPVHNPSVSIQIFDLRYQPYNRNGVAKALVIDSLGRFRCDSITPGFYNVLGYDTVQSECFFLREIQIDNGKQTTFYTNFKPVNTINGNIHNRSNVSADAFGVYITGTPFFQIADSTGAFSFTRVPAGTFTIKADYFSVTNESEKRYVRIKGSIPTTTTLDSLIVYTDSATVTIDDGKTVEHIDLSL